ncbi:major capsid protein, partial [Salmonella enterica subsp. enterica serovar Typhimurium]|nr:major capsid protein [Salmonella enterica subsp. enterica serovar Typhimurium]
LWDDVEGVQYMGELVGANGAGRMRIWVNTQKYRDQNDQEQFLMKQKAVMGISSAIEGVRCFGAILDKGAGYQALDYFPKMWDQEDPSVEYLMSQGAPLMVPADPNASFLLTVMS